MESNEESLKVISRNEEQGEVPWITRKKSGSPGDSLGDIPWVTEWSLQDVMSHMARNRRLKGNKTRKDCFEFIIIDQVPGQEFNILNKVTGALSLAAGDPPLKKVRESVIRSSLPREEQTPWPESAVFSGVPLALSLSPSDFVYEGRRTRALDVLDRDIGFLSRFQKRTTSLRGRRIVSKILSDMEKAGIISALKTREPSFAHPILLQATDGHEDLYIVSYFRPVIISSYACSMKILNHWNNPQILDAFA